MAAGTAGRSQDVGDVIASEAIPLEHEPLAQALAARLSEPAAGWLAQQRDRVARDPDTIATVFPAVGRFVGRGPLHRDSAPDDPHAWTADDGARTLLLVSLQAHAAGHIALLYRHGDAAERRGVLRSLPFLTLDDTTGVPLVEDALRTNDLRLIAAALGPYGTAKLSDAALTHAVLKCVFLGIPIAGIAGIERRAGAEMAAMLARYAHERVAAGRTVPSDIWPLIDRFAPVAELAAIEAELDHPQPDRRRAARQALAGRAQAHTHTRIAGGAASED